MRFRKPQFILEKAVKLLAGVGYFSIIVVILSVFACKFNSDSDEWELMRF